MMWARSFQSLGYKDRLEKEEVYRANFLEKQYKKALKGSAACVWCCKQ